MIDPQILLQKNIPFIKRLMGDSPHETAFFKLQITQYLKAFRFTSIEVKFFDFLHPWVPSPFIHITERIGRIIEDIPFIRSVTGSLLITAKKAYN